MEIETNALAPEAVGTTLVNIMPAEQEKYMMVKIFLKRCGTLNVTEDIIGYSISERNIFNPLLLLIWLAVEN